MSMYRLIPNAEILGMSFHFCVNGHFQGMLLNAHFHLLIGNHKREWELDVVVGIPFHPILAATQHLGLWSLCSVGNVLSLRWSN